MTIFSSYKNILPEFVNELVQKKQKKQKKNAGFITLIVV